MSAKLPGKPGKRLQEVWDSMTGERRAAFLPHLLGDASADYLADWLERAGTPVSATTIKLYRQALRRSEVKV